MHHNTFEPANIRSIVSLLLINEIPMRYRDIFPYQQRQLGLQEMKTEKELRCDTTQLTRVAMSNLHVGDTIPFSKGEATITAIDDKQVSYDYKTISGQVGQATDSAEQLEQGILFSAFKDTLLISVPDYCHPICQIVERDPAVYRLQTQQGWVINDELALYSGNVIPEFPKIKKSKPSSTDETLDTQGQGSFGF